MSIRFDAAADRIVRTSSVLSSRAAYTVCCWAYPVSVSAFGIIFSLNVNDQFDSSESYGVSSGGLASISVNSIFASAATGSALSADTWYHMAFVRTAQAGDVLFYLNGVLDITHAHSTEFQSTSTRMEFGGVLTTDQSPFSGRVAAIKLYSTNLSVAEIQNEMHKILPSRTDSLTGWYPGFPGAVERLADYSGLGRNWTEAGTLTDEDPPPVGWGAWSLYPQPLIAAASGWGQLLSNSRNRLVVT